MRRHDFTPITEVEKEVHMTFENRPQIKKSRFCLSERLKIPRNPLTQSGY